MAEWNPSDYDPEVEAKAERRQQDQAAMAAGVDRDTVNAWIRAEWIRFEARMREWAEKSWRETGVDVADSTKTAHRRDFHRALKAVYGRSLPDQAWSDALEKRLAHPNSGRAA